MFVHEKGFKNIYNYYINCRIKRKVANLRRREEIKKTRALENSKHFLNQSCLSCFQTFSLKNYIKVSDKIDSFFMSCFECRRRKKEVKRRR